jgi:nitrate reductase NapE component
LFWPSIPFAQSVATTTAPSSRQQLFLLVIVFVLLSLLARVDVGESGVVMWLLLQSDGG